MAPALNIFALLAVSSVGALAKPTTSLLDLLDIVTLDLPPLVTVTTTAPATTATTFTSDSTVYYWTPETYPTSTSVPNPPVSTVTVTATTTVATTTTVTATATATGTCPGAFKCDKYGYWIQVTKLFRVDIATGTTTLIKANVVDNAAVNAIGYNTLDNFLYGRHTGSEQLIRISADGTATPIGPLTNGGNNGDIDTDGYYWYSAGGATWNQVDLRPDSATYGQLIDSGTATTIGAVPDWAYIPSAGRYMYTVLPSSDGASTIFGRFSLDTKSWEAVGTYPAIARNNWGPMYPDNNGTLYATDSDSGQIWAFPVAGGRPSLVSRGPAAGEPSDDGARCVLNVDL